MEKIYGQGIFFKKPAPNAPQFVKGKVSIKTEEFIKFLQQHTSNEWVNLDLLFSDKKGTYYFTLNQWTKSKTEQEKELPVIDINRVPVEVKETNEEPPADINW